MNQPNRDRALTYGCGNPFVAGGGERLFDGATGIELKPVSSRTAPQVTHLVYRR